MLRVDVRSRGLARWVGIDGRKALIRGLGERRIMVQSFCIWTESQRTIHSRSNRREKKGRSKLDFHTYKIEPYSGNPCPSPLLHLFELSFLRSNFPENGTENKWPLAVDDDDGCETERELPSDTLRVC